MKRLYYLASDLSDCQRAAVAMHGLGIGDRHFHVLSRNESGLTRGGIHAATTYQQLDFIHTGLRFAIAGALLGLFAGYVLIRFEPFPAAYDWLIVLGAAALLASFGGWEGVMLGISRENYKLAPFHFALTAGKHLLMIDVQPGSEEAVRQVMAERFPGAEPAGTDTTLVNPFASPRAVFVQNTH